MLRLYNEPPLRGLTQIRKCLLSRGLQRRRFYDETLLYRHQAQDSQYFAFRTCNEFSVYLWYSVFAFKSSKSMFGSPEINNSSSCSSKMEIRRLGMMS